MRVGPGSWLKCMRITTTEARAGAVVYEQEALLILRREAPASKEEATGAKYQTRKRHEN